MADSITLTLKPLVAALRATAAITIEQPFAWTLYGWEVPR